MTTGARLRLRGRGVRAGGPDSEASEGLASGTGHPDVLGPGYSVLDARSFHFHPTTTSPTSRPFCRHPLYSLRCWTRPFLVLLPCPMTPTGASPERPSRRLVARSVPRADLHCQCHDSRQIRMACIYPPHCSPRFGSACPSRAVLVCSRYYATTPRCDMLIVLSLSCAAVLRYRVTLAGGLRPQALGRGLKY